MCWVKAAVVGLCSARLGHSGVVLVTQHLDAGCRLQDMDPEAAARIAEAEAAQRRAQQEAQQAAEEALAIEAQLQMQREATGQEVGAAWLPCKPLLEPTPFAALHTAQHPASAARVHPGHAGRSARRPLLDVAQRSAPLDSVGPSPAGLSGACCRRRTVWSASSVSTRTS